jgi:hypothetical protein
MKAPVVHRLALGLVAAIALANAGFGSCGGGSAACYFCNPNDGGIGGNADMAYYPGFDGGQAFDQAAPGEWVQLTAPPSLASGIALDASFDFNAYLLGATPQDLEPLISVTPRTSTTAVNGGFSWKSTGTGLYSISFLPTGLSDKTDYVVTVMSPTIPGKTLLKTGISTGSHPRVNQVELFGENMASAVYFKFHFSEPMDPASIASHVTVSAGTGMTATLVTGKVTTIVSTTDANTGFRFDFDNGKGLPQPITLHVAAAATSAAGTTLDTKSWDSMTQETNGDFFVDFDGITLDNQPGTISWQWTPVIN